MGNVPKNPKERESVNIDRESMEWIENYKDRGEFSSCSDGIRRCIRIARRIYEEGTPEDRDRYILGRRLESPQNESGEVAPKQK
jgi:Arc/MetJ-type ribon-helix-helix transcriptional regulator